MSCSGFVFQKTVPDSQQHQGIWKQFNEIFCKNVFKMFTNKREITSDNLKNSIAIYFRIL